MRFTLLFCLVSAIFLPACGDDDTTADSGMDASADSEVSDGSTSDGAIRDASSDAPTEDAASDDASIEDAGTDAGEDASAEDASAEDASAEDAGPDGATEDAGTTSGVRASNATGMANLDVAKFGRNLDGSLHLEIYAEAADECPSMDSPSPAQTLIVGTLPSAEGTHEVSLGFLDFAGDLTDVPIVRGMAEVDLSGNETDGEIGIVLMGMGEGIEFAGEMRAQHCVSLDATE